MSLASQFPALGFQPEKRVCRVFNRAGSTLTKGQVCEFNIYKAGNETSTIRFGEATSVFANVIAPAFTLHGFFGVALEDIPDDMPGLVQVTGVVSFCQLNMAKLAVTDMTWDEATLTLTKTNGFASYTFNAGDQIQITAGTGATLGFYFVNAKTDDSNIELQSSIGAAADQETDIDGTIFAAGIEGMSLTVSASPRQLTPAANLTGKTVGILLSALSAQAVSGKVLFEGLKAFGTGS